MKPEDRKRLKQHIEMIVEHKIPSNVVFCPNCEKDTECIHTAELYECKECGEDFAKYIVSRNCNVSDVSITQDVLTDIKTPRSIENNNPDYYKHDELKKENAELKADLKNKNTRIAELSQAVGLITTLKPTMVMDADHPLEMAKEVAEYVNARIAELEAERRWIPVSERLPEERQNVLALDRTGTAYHWEYSRSLSNIFVGYYTHWMPLPNPPEVE